MVKQELSELSDIVVIVFGRNMQLMSKSLLIIGLFSDS